MADPIPETADTALVPTLLGDVIPRVESAYVLGLPSPQILDLVLERSRSTTVLVATDEEASQLKDELPDAVELVTAGIAAFAQDRRSQPRELVLALGGLDGLLPPADTMPWQQRLAHVTALAQAGGTVIVGLGNDAPLMALGHAERIDWARADDDPTRPTSAAALAQALAAAGQPVTTVHGLYGDPVNPGAAVIDALATGSRDGSLPAQVVEHVIDQAGTASIPAPDVVAVAARSGQLSNLATQWVAVSGGRGRSVYWTVDDAVVWADQDGPGLDWVIGGDADTAAALPQRVPDTITVERTLLRHIARADLPAFRAVARQLGDWVRSSADAAESSEIRLDEVRVAGATLARGISLRHAPVTDAAPVAEDAPDVEREPDPSARQVSASEARLAQAWRRFATRFAHSGRRSAWPAIFGEEDLVQLWLTMSGVAPGTVAPEADAPAVAVPAVVDEASRLDILQDRVAALTDTLAARDEQLLIREARIRTLRQQALGAARNRDRAVKLAQDLRRSRTYRLANQMRRASLVAQPKTLVRGVARKLDGKVRALRRTR
ncbi:hypothetical protein [Luteipulveratus mongoliensis]|uniref:Uncharacterized protein n=1 Tax=Luteipulveratus mongoliensis TaxID=571913 RepID=A0A0K1JHM4_9MICO|nr:hypothetical protein [Luteipulveratus mongoliensis]AKU16204.1 hypothetical protein VV02_10575 [Luteipulveratus mongoliensis]